MKVYSDLVLNFDKIRTACRSDLLVYSLKSLQYVFTNYHEFYQPVRCLKEDGLSHVFKTGFSIPTWQPGLKG